MCRVLNPNRELSRPFRHCAAVQRRVVPQRKAVSRTGSIERCRRFLVLVRGPGSWDDRRPKATIVPVHTTVPVQKRTAQRHRVFSLFRSEEDGTRDAGRAGRVSSPNPLTVGGTPAPGSAGALPRDPQLSILRLLELNPSNRVVPQSSAASNYFLYVEIPTTALLEIVGILRYIYHVGEWKESLCLIENPIQTSKRAIQATAGEKRPGSALRSSARASMTPRLG